MRRLRILTLSLLVPVFMAGCATGGGGPTIGGHTFQNVPCALIGAAVGAAAGGAAAGGGGAGIGLLGGAVMSQLFCGESEPVDSDGDWVPDEFDKCPDTPEGLGVDGDGCPLDSDGDGVPDHEDQCYREYGLGPDGCPLDADGDGVPDDKDKCPGTPAGTEVDATGCPMMKETLFIESIHFDFDRSNIKPVSKAVLDARAIPVLKKNPDVKVLIVGHTDSIGTDRYNQGLSMRRATSVRDYLASKGIASGRMSIAGRGEKEPIDTNKTRAGRANNRRVEFVIQM